MKFFAGRITRLTLAVLSGRGAGAGLGTGMSCPFAPSLTAAVVGNGRSGLVSISVQIGCRFPVCTSMTTTGARGSRYLPRSVIGTAPVSANAAGLSRPGTRTTII